MPLGQLDELDGFLATYGLDDTEPSGFSDILVGPSAQSVRVDTLILSNFDTVDHTIGFGWGSGADSNLFVRILVPAGSGAGTVPPVDALAFMRDTANHFLIVTSTRFLYFQLVDALSAGKFAQLTAMGGRLAY